MENSAGNDVELISKTLQVEHKIFYFDLKENPRGQYLKISEKTSGSRSTIIVPASGIHIFTDLFKYYAAGDNGKESRLQGSDVQLDTKVFYFDVGENQRGRFLKISEVTRNRSTIIVPAGNADCEGWAAFRDILAEISEGQQLLTRDKKPSTIQESSEHILPSDGTQGDAYTDDGAMVLPSTGNDTFSKILRAEQKKFFFDLGSNTRGQYLRISEVTGADRSAIILPISALEQFHEMVGQFVETVRNQGPAGSGIANVRSGAAPRKWSDG